MYLSSASTWRLYNVESTSMQRDAYILIIFLFFPEIGRRQFAWNIKAYFPGEKKCFKMSSAEFFTQSVELKTRIYKLGRGCINHTSVKYRHALNHHHTALNTSCNEDILKDTIKVLSTFCWKHDSCYYRPPKLKGYCWDVVRVSVC